MQSFALALLATTSLAATSVTLDNIMKATGRVGHIVQGTGTTQTLDLQVSMEVDMLKAEKIMKDETPYAWMCTQYSPTGTSFDCQAFKFERKLDGSKTKTSCKMTQVDMPMAGLKVDAAAAVAETSITGYWSSLSGATAPNSAKTVEVKSA